MKDLFRAAINALAAKDAVGRADYACFDLADDGNAHRALLVALFAVDASAGVGRRAASFLLLTVMPISLRPAIGQSHEHHTRPKNRPEMNCRANISTLPAMMPIKAPVIDT